MAPFTETRDFAWNVENNVSTQLEFTYYVGEGPLYWFRIDWVHSICPPNDCADFAPSVISTAPNCPYDIVLECVELPPDPLCPCDVSCPPNGDKPCVSQMVEVWHMLATSVTHLCERINGECCHKKPMKDYYIKRVQQYMRPALCCDVNTTGGADEYVDVDFSICECGNLVHPCIQRFIYPCNINICGINGEAFVGVDPLPPSTIDLMPDIKFSLIPVVEEVVPMKSMLQPNRIEKYGVQFPEVMHCSHNIGQTNLFGDFLKRTKQSFNNLDLFYNKEYNSWHGSKSFNTGAESWRVLLDWSPAHEGYKVNLSIDRGMGAKTLRTKVSWTTKGEAVNKSVDLDLTSGNLKYKTVLDNIGMFKNWKNELKLNLKG